MRVFMGTFWSVLVSILTGVDKYAQAFAATGDVALDVTTQFRDEERLKHQATRKRIKSEMETYDL